MINCGCRLYGPGDARLEYCQMPAIKDNHDVIVRVEYVGLCGSDVHFWLHGASEHHVTATNPLAVGHVASGIVDKVGSAVKTLKSGDQVVIEAGFDCQVCKQCKSGRSNLCPRIDLTEDPAHTYGFFSTFVKVPADWCHDISTSTAFTTCISLAEAMLLEPLAIAVHAVQRGGVKPGDTVAVFGAGPVGLLCVAALRHFGAKVIVSADFSEEKLDFAEDWILPLPDRTALFLTHHECESLTAEQNVNRLRWWLKTQASEPDSEVPAVDVIIETTGSELCIQTALHSLRFGGSFVQFGLGNGNINFPIVMAMEKEITVKGSLRYEPGDFKLALEMARSEKVRLKELIPKIVPFENAAKAWECLGDKERQRDQDIDSNWTFTKIAD